MDQNGWLWSRAAAGFAAALTHIQTLVPAWRLPESGRLFMRFVRHRYSLKMPEGLPRTYAAAFTSLAARLVTSSSTFVICAVPHAHSGTSASASVLPNGVSE